MISQGPSALYIRRQVIHKTYVLHPKENDNWKYGQLYIIDNEEANNFLINNHIKCSHDI